MSRAEAQLHVLLSSALTAVRGLLTARAAVPCDNKVTRTQSRVVHEVYVTADRHPAPRRCCLPQAITGVFFTSIPRHNSPLFIRTYILRLRLDTLQTLFLSYLKIKYFFSGNLASFKQTLTHNSACFSECTQRRQTGPSDWHSILSLHAAAGLFQCHPLNKAKPTSVYKTNPEVSTNWDECQLYQQGSSVSQPCPG